VSAPWILVIGGHDPSGGAGITADEEAARAFGVDTRSVVTARTDQDEHAVRSVGARDATEWATEASELARERPGAIKFGLLPGAASVRAAAALIRRWRTEQPRVPVIVDPVLASSSGFDFLDVAARTALVAELLPVGPILTPNLPECAELAKLPAALSGDSRARVAAAQVLLGRGAAAIVQKGGHAGGELVRDLLLLPPASITWIEQSRAPNEARSLRGTGCRHASALAAGLAHGRNLVGAARDASYYVGREMRR
jgi:hydroxymethylpyrimidine/phosphomethylpyrimidine kinase